MIDSTYHRYGPFVIIRLLGQGAMGEVHLARTQWSDAPLLAVKLLKAELARKDLYARRFAREASLALRLDHPNVVAAIGSGEVDGRPYLGSKYVAGKDLGTLVSALASIGEPLPINMAVRVLLDILSGLSYLHEAQGLDGRALNLVHRDISLGNILVGYDGRARISDFGIAASRLPDERGLSQSNMPLGHPGYRAPELNSGQRASPAADVYAAGALIRRALKLSVAGELTRMPSWLDDFLHGMIATEPDERGTATDLQSVLEQGARRANALVGSVTCARWLEATFPRERKAIVEEEKRLLAFDFEAVPMRADDTVTFNRLSFGPDIST